MENIQINGQKIWGPPKDWVGPPPPHGTEVFIKNIPDDVFEDELYYLFSTVGRVYEVRLPVHWTGMNKGYAFVRFTKISEADKGIEKLNMCTIRQGRQLKVERSLDNTRLFLSSVPNDKTGEEIKSSLLTVVENVKTVYVYPALENSCLFRGYAFVEFQTHRDAAIAKRILTPDILFNLFDRKCVAAWANPLPFLNKETLKNINILFMRNIPNNTKSITIRLKVDALIAPDVVHKVKRLNDYAFLTFKNHDIAERAMIKIKCKPSFLGAKPVHVEWAIPREFVGSVSPTKNSKDDDCSEVNLENLESHPSLFKILQDYKKDHPKFVVEDYINMNKLEAENKENIPFSLPVYPHRGMNLTILPRLTSKTDSQPSFNKYDTENYLGLRKTNIERNEKMPLTEFYQLKSEDYYRALHLRNWLQSLTINDQYSPCTSSPTSLSTGSSTNLSWKCDEGWSQFSNGNASPKFNGWNMAGNDRTLQQVREFRYQTCKKRTNSTFKLKT